MDLLKLYDDRIAESEERILKYTQLVEQASTDPEMRLSLSIATKALASERQHKQKMEEMRAGELQLRRRLANLKRRSWITAIVAIAVAAALLALHFKTQR